MSSNFRIAKAKKVTGYESGVPFRLTVVELVWDDLTIAKDQWLSSEAAEAFRAMYKAAQVSGLTLKVNSSWRSYAHQKQLRDTYDKWLVRWSSQPTTSRGPRRCAPANPGHSNHHNGIAIDINRSHDDPDGDGPEIGITDSWLRLNASKFGFTNPYRHELWHWEYHGV